MLLLSVTGCVSTQSSYDKYPEKTVKLLVPWPAGGSTDLIARALGNAAENHFSQPVIVENREGGSGTIGTQEVASSKGDGYTILVAAIAPTILQPHYLDLNYTPESFKAIAQVSVRDVVVAVKKDAPWNTLEELIKDAKSEPEKISYAVTKGVHNQLLFEMLSNEAGFKAKLYPVQGDMPSITAVLSNVADVSVVSSISVIKPQLDAGEMKALAIFSANRSSLLPDVPTVKELGYDLVGNPWTGLMVPKDTPDELVKVISAKFKALIEDPGFVENMEKIGETIDYLGPDEFMNKVLKEYKEFGEVIESLGLGK